MNPRPRYLPMVLAFAGDSTMTNFPRPAVEAMVPDLAADFFLVFGLAAGLVDSSVMCLFSQLLNDCQGEDNLAKDGVETNGPSPFLR